MQSPAAALYVDIDGFKHVNDSFGHAVGDHFLRLVAERLRSVVREPYDLPRGRAAAVADREHRGAQGMDDTAERLLASADVALYVAKTSGRDRYVVFESGMQAAAHDRLTLEMDLGDALEADQLFLLYQPTVALDNERVIGVEALLRWRYPERGVISPEVFIPLAEGSGVIVPIGRWVLEQACAQAAAWQRMGFPLRMSVNVSARQLERDDLIDDARAALESSGLDPGQLTLEITETTLMHDPQATVERLISLKRLGVRIAVDDFGTGYSSLAYLRELPVDALKIDRSFIRTMSGSAQSAALIHTLVRLGKTLQLETLAEGIEDRTQLRALRRQHCDQGQWYLFARPLTPEQIEDLLGAAGEEAVAR